jgi:chromosomal replication initiation ATPase DnaA
MSRPPRVNAVIRQVADKYAIPAMLITSQSRSRIASHPRQEVYAELQDLGFSLGAIGGWLERHHTSVLYGARAHRARQEQS